MELSQDNTVPAWFVKLKQQLHQVIIGQDRLLDNLSLALLCNGHVLLEGLPGLAKTLAVNTLAQSLQLQFSRIQFTPDLLPSDLIGTMIYDQENQQFIPKKGPVFGNIILADEVNRAPAKVQAALLEAMQERQVTLGENSHQLPHPFLVLATQNPIEQEGTYELPEAQLDRFLFKVTLDYPTAEDELRILQQHGKIQQDNPQFSPIDWSEIEQAKQEIEQVYIAPELEKYIVNLIHSTRNMKELIAVGASPRATIALLLSAKAKAYLTGSTAVMPEHITQMLFAVVNHRITLSYQAQADGVTKQQCLEQCVANTLLL